jgi:hypothetical protein
VSGWNGKNAELERQLFREFMRTGQAEKLWDGGGVGGGGCGCGGCWFSLVRCWFVSLSGKTYLGTVHVHPL